MTNIELLALLDRTRREIKMYRFAYKSVPASLQQLVREVERELLVRGYDVDYSDYVPLHNPLPVEVLAHALQDTVHKPYFGKARAGRSMKIPKI